MRKSWFAQYDFFPEEAALLVYNHFAIQANNAVSLTAEEQTILGKTYHDLLQKLSTQDALFVLSVQIAISKLCFYRFFKMRKLPSNLILQKFYWKGFVAYVKQFLTSKYN